ncbi:MAG TPA: hypothetical protein DCP92_02975 [Nitrospiraceae bacterium]|nr:hypothetical protein [Nitrospiraceae bacterium]
MVELEQKRFQITKKETAHFGTNSSTVSIFDTCGLSGVIEIFREMSKVLVIGWPKRQKIRPAARIL